MNPRNEPQTPLPPGSPPRSPLAIIARAAADDRQTWTHPAGPIALLLDAADGTIHALGPATGLDLRGAEIVEHPNSVLIPGLVNAHTHLDLTCIGPQPHDPDHGFMAWIDMVVRERPTDPDAIRAAVRQGVALSRAGGTVAIGDIAGAPQGRPSIVACDEFQGLGMFGVTFLEFFAIGSGLDRALRATESELAAWTHDARHPLTRLGLSPHAPNTVGLGGYEWAVAQAAHAPTPMPLCTHLAESPAEREFISRATGPQRAFLERFGLWNDRVAAEVGHGRSPIEHLEPLLAAARTIAVHCNDVTDTDLDILARTRTSVVYCPRASTYFGAPDRLGPHRYRDMLARGIPVALGTDSIINLPAHASNPELGGISTLDEMRFLFARDGTDPATLLRMATTAGAEVLDLPDPNASFHLRPGSRPLGLLMIDVTGAPRVTSPLEAVLAGTALPKFVWTRKNTV